MALYTTYSDGSTIAPDKTTHTGPTGAPAIIFFSVIFDAARRALAAADTVDLLNIPAGSIVQGFTSEIQTADAGGATIGIGEGASAGVYVAAATAISATTKPTPGSGSATYPRAIASDTTARMTVAAAAVTTLKLKVTIQILLA